MIRAWTFLLCLVILTSLVLPVKASNSQFPCEQYISFVNPDDAWAKEWLAEELSQKELQHWPVSYKRAVCDAFCQIQRKAPGLVARACNGEKIRMVLSRNPRSEADPLCVQFSITSFKTPGLRELLMHELVHAADAGNLLSQSREWNRLVVPRLQSFRVKNKVSNEWVLGTVDQYNARRLGLPSSYAASNPTEALAECTTAMVIAGWTPPSGIRSFISGKLLNRYTPLDSELSLLRQAYAHLKKHNYEKSVELCTQILRLNSAHIQAWLYLACAWESRGEPELCKFSACRALQLLTRNGAPLYDIDMSFCYKIHGAACHQLEQYQNAINDYNRVISLDPKNAQVYYWRGHAYADLEQYKKAIQDYSKAISLDPKNAQIYYYRGAMHSALGKDSKAIDDFNKAILMKPSCAEAYNDRGWAYGKIGYYSKAIYDCNKVLTLNQKFAAAAYDTRGYVFGRQTQYQKAINECTKAIRIDAKYAAAYYHRAEFYKKMNKKDLADRDKEIAKTLGYKPEPGE